VVSILAAKYAARAKNAAKLNQRWAEALTETYYSAFSPSPSSVHRPSSIFNFQPSTLNSDFNLQLFSLIPSSKGAT
jgi:hypothetical protein